MTERLKEAVRYKAEWLKEKGLPVKGCKCGMWRENPWILLLISSGKKLDEEGKKTLEEIVMAWQEHMNTCKGTK